MEKKRYLVLLTVLLIVGLCSCNKVFQRSEDMLSGQSATGTDEDFSNKTPGEQSELLAFPVVSEESEEQRSARLEAYQFALQQIALEHVWPDGSDSGFDNIGSIEDNLFAICDVDGDGFDELIIQFTTAPMAGNSVRVYGFDNISGALTNELTEFPALTFYTNGFIKADWSHGDYLTGDYWPYTLYRYAAKTDTYDEFAQVNMWSKSADTVNYQGDPYPEEIDAEGAGTVFIISQNGETKTISKSEYDEWLSKILEATSEQMIPYQALSEDNIKSVNDNTMREPSTTSTYQAAQYLSIITDDIEDNSFSLIYLDDDEIPELVILDGYLNRYSIYTIKDDGIKCLVDSVTTVEMTYYERKNIICTFFRWNGGGDEGSYGSAYYKMDQYSEILTGESTPTFQVIYNATYNESGEWSGTGNTSYYEKGEEVDEAAYNQIIADFNIAQDNEISCFPEGISHLTKEEIVTYLNSLK